MTHFTDEDRNILRAIRTATRQGNIGYACTLVNDNPHLASIALEQTERDTGVTLLDKLAFFECVRDLQS